LWQKYFFDLILVVFITFSSYERKLRQK
jgi:hypothetical protein